MLAEQSLEKTTQTNLINKLAAYEPGKAVFLSLYLDAQPKENGRENFTIWLKKELSERENDFAEESAERRKYNELVERIIAFAAEIQPEAGGAAVFASVGTGENETDADFFRTAQFIAPIEANELIVSDRPYIFPIARLIEQNPRYACVWADTNAARIYLFGGELALNAEAEAEAQVEEIHNVKTQRQQQGGWSQMRFQRRVDNFHHQHAKEVVETLGKLVLNEKLETIVLSGDAGRILAILRDEMPKQMAEKVIAEMSLNQYASEKELHDASLEIVRRHDAEVDREKTVQLSDEVGAQNLGVVGVSATLAALSNGQVQELLILSDTSRIRYNEERVEKVLEDYAPGDDNSSNDALPDVHQNRQVLDEIVVRAINSAARIRFIEDATLLMSVGGVGAILRYKI